jgi:hypothetical protein
MGRPKAKNMRRDSTTGRSRGPQTAEIIEVAFRNRIRRVGSAAIVVDQRTGAARAHERSGYSLGILRLWDQISEDQFAAGEWYAGVVHRYCALHGLRLPVPKSPALILVGAGRTCAAEPKKEDMDNAALKHRGARTALLVAGTQIGVGSRVNAITYAVCVEDRAPESLNEADLGNLRVGLNALARVS